MAVVLPGIWPPAAFSRQPFLGQLPQGVTSKPPQPLNATTGAPCPLFTPPEKPPKAQPPLKPTETRDHTQELQWEVREPRAEQAEPDLVHEQLPGIISTARAALPKALQRTQRAPKITPWAGTAAKPQLVPFGMNFSELLNIQKRDWPFLGPSLRNSWPSPLPHLPHVTWKSKGRGWQQSGFLTGSRKTSPGVVFSLHPKGSGIGTFKAPGRSSRLATLSPRRVSVKAGHGDECSYLARLENSSWPHLAHT